MTTSLLTAEKLEQYDRDGWVLVRGAAGPEVLKLARIVLERWADQTIESWVQRGLLSDPLRDLDFHHRLVKAWEAAGRPAYSRSPRRDLVSLEVYRLLAHPDLLKIGAALLNTQELSLHGVFNARPKLPDQKWTDTPWHQDAQYFRDAESVHVPSLWIPLQRVTEKNSCLQVASGLHRGALHEGHRDQVSGFTGLSPEAQKGLQGISVEMDAGDVLCFTQKTPHRALPNLSDTVRWSMDMRYEATATATVNGRKQGFVAASVADPSSVESYEQWLEKWANIPAGSY